MAREAAKSGESLEDRLSSGRAYLLFGQLLHRWTIMPDNFELIPDARARAVHSMGGKLEDASGVQANSRNPEWPDMFFQIDHTFFSIEK